MREAGKGSNRRPENSESFTNGYERIFGNKRPEKGRFFWDEEKKEFVKAGEADYSQLAPVVRGDIQPYRSMVTGEIIEGRSQHRNHLKTHNVVEVGNDLNNAKPKSASQPDRLKESIARAVYDKLRY